MGLCIRACRVRGFAACDKCTNNRMKKLLLGVMSLGIICIIAIGLKFHVVDLGLNNLTSDFFSVGASNLTSGLFNLGASNLASGLFRLGASNLTNGTSNFSPGLQKKMLIYVCVGKQGCSGWSDRQRSIVSMFLLALVTNRRFGILFQIPCDVRNFYMPNKYDWIVNEKDLKGRSQRLIRPVDDNLQKIDFNQEYPEDVLFARENNDGFYKISSNPHYKPFLPSWAKIYYDLYFYNGWNILMKPTPKVQRRLDNFLESVNFYNRTKPLVGVHLRMGKNPSNPHDGPRFNNVSNLGPLWQRVERYVKNGSQLFLASDSQEVRNLSRRHFGAAHHDTDGIIMHIGWPRGDACQGFEDAILDQLILSYCDILFLSKGGFGLRAARMGRRMKRIFRFYNGKVIP